MDPQPTTPQPPQVTPQPEVVNPTPPPLEAPAQTLSEQSKSKGHKKLIILIVLTLFLLSGAGATAYFMMNPKTAVAPTPTPQTTPSPTPIPWTAYTTSEYSFQLPLTIRQDPDANIYGPYENALMITTFTDSETKVPNTDAPFDGFTIYELQLNNRSLDEQIAFDVKQFTDPPRVNPEFEITSREETIGDFNVKIITTEDLNHELYYIKDPARDKVVIFSVLYKTEAFTEIFNQILSTFQFTK